MRRCQPAHNTLQGCSPQVIIRNFLAFLSEHQNAKKIFPASSASQYLLSFLRSARFQLPNGFFITDMEPGVEQKQNDLHGLDWHLLQLCCIFKTYAIFSS